MRGLSLGVRSLVRRSGLSVDIARLALVSLLVVLVALGVHGHFVTPTWHTRSKTRDVFVAAALEAVVVTLLLFLWARSRSARPGDQLEARLRTALLAVLGTVAVALTATGLLFAPGTSAPGGSGAAVSVRTLTKHHAPTL